MPCLTSATLQNIGYFIRPPYKKKNRHNICYTLFGLLQKSSVDCATSLLHLLSKNDEEKGSRISNFNATYKKNRMEVSGYNALYTTPKYYGI